MKNNSLPVRLPATTLAAALSQPAPVKRIAADLLPVKDRSGETLYYVTARAAQRMIERGTAIPLGTKNTVRALQLPPEYDDSKIIPITAYTGQHYSHHSEVSETYIDERGRERRRDPMDPNPEGVWTVKRLARQIAPLFDTVMAERLGWPALKKASGQFVRWVSKDEAADLLQSKRVIITGDKHRFWLEEIPAKEKRERKAA